MIVILSPAKTMDLSRNNTKIDSTTPVFIEKAEYLVNLLKKMNIDEISDLMKISSKLADVNFERIASWKLPFNLSNSKQAIYSYSGSVFNEILIDGFQEEDFIFLQKNFRIFSGLYGILRPFDLIQPYRLEMSTSLKTSKGKNLYNFWADNITKELNDLLEYQKDDILLNLASTEYIRALDKDNFKGNIINIKFKEKRNDTYKIIGTNSKIARGLMSNFIIKNKITNIEELKKFNLADYEYNDDMSNANNLVFTRE